MLKNKDIFGEVDGIFFCGGGVTFFEEKLWISEWGGGGGELRLFGIGLIISVGVKIFKGGGW